MRQPRTRAGQPSVGATTSESGITNGSGRLEQIMDASIRMFFEKGYHETSIQDIADAAGVGKSSLYYYINTKEELLFAIHERFINHLLDRIDALATSDLAPREKLEAIIVDAVQVVARYQPIVTIFFAEIDTLSPELLQRITPKRDAYEHTLTRVLQEGIDDGVFVSNSAKLASLSILGMVNWCYRWLRPDGPQSPEEIGHFIATLVLDGLAVRTV